MLITIINVSTDSNSNWTLYKQRDISGSSDKTKIPVQKKNLLRFEKPHSHPEDFSPTILNKSGAQNVRRVSVYTCSGMWCVCNVIKLRFQGCGVFVV